MKKLIEVSAEENDMENQFSRTERLLGKENMEKLAAARVCIFGIGGVDWPAAAWDIWNW